MQGRDWPTHSVCCRCSTCVLLASARSWLFPFPVPVQTVNEGAYRIRDFRLRFYASESMWQPPQEVDASTSLSDCRLLVSLKGTRGQGITSPRTRLSTQAADEFLKGVLTEAAKDVHSQPVSDVMAMLRQGERRETNAARYCLAHAIMLLLLSLQ